MGCGEPAEQSGGRSAGGRGERKCGRQERNLKSHCSGRAEAERAEESNHRRTLDNMDVSSAMEKVGQKHSQKDLHLYSWNSF